MNIVLIKDKRSMMEGYVQGRRPLENYELAFRRFFVTSILECQSQNVG